MSDNGDSVDLDLTEPKVKAWMDALDHIEAAMALVNKNDGAWSALSQAKTAAERSLGAVLFNRARAVINQQCPAGYVGCTITSTHRHAPDIGSTSQNDGSTTP